MEVLIALVLIVLSVIALISLLSAGMRMDRVSNNNSAAVMVAKGYMEQMLAYSNFPNVENIYNDASTVRRQVTYNGDSTTYTYNWSVQASPAPYNAYFKQYVVNVYWLSAKSGYTTSVTLISARAYN